MSMVYMFIAALQAAVPEGATPSVPVASNQAVGTNVASTVLDPCPAMLDVLKSANGVPHAFFTLRNPDKSLKALPGLNGCEIVFSHTVALRCLGQRLEESASQDSKELALAAYAEALGGCLPTKEYTRSIYDEGPVSAYGYGAGQTKPFFQFSMTSQLEAGVRVFRPEMLVIGPDERETATQIKAKSPSRAKAKARPAKRRG